MSYTQADLDALRAAMSNGALTVKSGEKLVTYRSVQELQQQISIVESELGVRNRRHSLAYVSKG